MEAAFFEKLLNDYLIPSIPGSMVSEVLEITSDEKATALTLLVALDKNPKYRELLLSISLLKEKVTRWTAEEEGQSGLLRDTLLNRTLNLLGKTTARNALIGIKLKELVGYDQLTFCLKAEEFCQDRGLPFADRAYIAGLHYDWLKGLMNVQKVAPDSKAYIDLMLKQGLHTANIAHQIGSHLKNLKYGNDAFGAGLLVHLGHALMGLLFPKALTTGSWQAFVADCDKIEGPGRDIAFKLREKKRFPITHSELLSLYVGFFDGFREVEKALRFYQTPYMLKTSTRDQWELCCVLHLAVSRPRKEFTPLEKKVIKELKLSEEWVLMLIRDTLAKG